MTSSPADVPGPLARFTGCKTVLLATHKRDGTWVPTAVNLVIGDGRAYFRTYHTAGKHKRLRNFSEVKVAPCTMRGKPTGPSSPAQARLLDAAEDERARELLAKGFPIMHGKVVPWVHRRKGWRTVHYELTVGD